MTCPVCEMKLPNPIPLFCEQCGWDLKHDITLVPSLHELPQDVVEEYNQRLSIAKENWEERFWKNCTEIGTIESYSEYIKNYPEGEYLFLAYDFRGDAYNDKGDDEKAIADFTALIKIEPDSASSYFCRGRAYRNKGDYDRAITDYTEAIRLRQSAVYYQCRGNAFEKLRAYNEAIRDYTKAVELDPKSAKYDLAILLKRLGHSNPI